MPETSVEYALIERFCATPKKPENNEDRLVVARDFVAVIDGSTASGPFQGRPGGIVAAEAVAATVLALSPEATARQFVDHASALLAERIGAWPDPGLSRPTASVVVWSRRRREIWRVGDCHFRVDDLAYNGEKPVDRLAYDFRCAVVRARLALGLTSSGEESAAATLDQPFMPLVRVQHAFANADIDDPLAYGVINGAPIPDRFIELHSTANAREIVLCSDGFPAPYASLGQGLAEIARLRREDPLLVKSGGSRPFPPGADFFDDTTYVRFAPR